MKTLLIVRSGAICALLGVVVLTAMMLVGLPAAEGMAVLGQATAPEAFAASIRPVARVILLAMALDNIFVIAYSGAFIGAAVLVRRRARLWGMIGLAFPDPGIARFGRERRDGYPRTVGAFSRADCSCAYLLVRLSHSDQVCQRWAGGSLHRHCSAHLPAQELPIDCWNGGALPAFPHSQRDCHREAGCPNAVDCRHVADVVVEQIGRAHV